MIIRNFKIENFRGIYRADLNFTKHNLFVGPNSVGKSTILESLDLLLGPERLRSPDAINEHDFYRSKYLDAEKKPIEIKIECVFIALTKREKTTFFSHLEFWNKNENRLLSSSEVSPEETDEEAIEPALRIAFRGRYDPEEDEFIATTYFSHPPVESHEEPELVTSKHKREFGFLFLRSLRTGARALTLERGSLLDIVLQLKEVRPGTWERVLDVLRKIGPTLDQDADFRSILNSIENQVNHYIPIKRAGKASEFQVTKLTRESLRKTASLFVASRTNDTLVPFQNIGHGAANVFVLALLTFIADLKAENDHNVIFAMEEPEIALPPYTQRKIVEQLKKKSNQCLFTSHSPYVAESFIPNDLFVIQRDGTDTLRASPIPENSTIKQKTLHREFRIRFAEGLLSKGILAVEGPSDQSALVIASRKMSEADPSYSSPDVLGIAVIEVGGDGSLPKFGSFFKSLGIKSFAFYDNQKDANHKQEIQSAFDIAKDHQCAGIEELICGELPLGVINQFLTECQSWSDYPQHISIPQASSEEEKRKLVTEILKARKGAGYTARLLDLVPPENLPTQICEFLKEIETFVNNSESAAPDDSPLEL
ncbi:MAG: AAA family ATPase [Elusimicrobia bacterium]|nr:AAA family ATPase [Elusimicrobiota bacterium]